MDGCYLVLGSFNSGFQVLLQVSSSNYSLTASRCTSSQAGWSEPSHRNILPLHGHYWGFYVIYNDYTYACAGGGGMHIRRETVLYLPSNSPDRNQVSKALPRSLATYAGLGNVQMGDISAPRAPPPRTVCLLTQ